MKLTATDLQNTCERMIAELIEMGCEAERTEGFAGLPRDIARARSCLNTVRIGGKQRELAESLQEGDFVQIKSKGARGTFRGFIKHAFGKIAVEREGYGDGAGWYDVDDIELIEVNELRRWVEICEKSLIRYDAERVTVSARSRANVAGWRTQLDRLVA